MHLSPHEQERLPLSSAAELARRRRARGLKLNLPEATVLVTDHVPEGARDGVLVAELMQSGHGPHPGRRHGRRPLPGGWVTTAWGIELHRVVRAADELTPAGHARVTA